MSQANHPPAIHKIADEFGASLAQVLQSMAEQRPTVQWESIAELQPGILAGEDEPLWWAQPFQLWPGPAVWAGAPRKTWEELGARTLRAAGLETVETADARSTWLEILGQSLSGLARSVGALLGREVTCESGGEQAPPADITQWLNVSIGLAREQFSLVLGVTPGLIEHITNAVAEVESAEVQPPTPVTDQPLAARGSTLDLLMDVELPVSISFGRTQIPLRDVLKLTTGSIVELNRGVGEPVEVLVNHSLIARGEVVVMDGNYGVRIQQIIRSEDRLRSIE